MTKLCPKCGVEKDVSEFYAHPTTRDRLTPICKECSKAQVKEWIADHKEQHKQLVVENRKAYRKTQREFLDSLKTPCAKCGESRLYLIQFHHRNPSEKSFCVASTNMRHSKAAFEEEAKKCVCLCSNCHDEFHWFYGKNPDEPVKALEEYLNT